MELLQGLQVKMGEAPKLKNLQIEKGALQKWESCEEIEIDMRSCLMKAVRNSEFV